MRGELVGIPSNILSRSGGTSASALPFPTSIARQDHAPAGRVRRDPGAAAGRAGAGRERGMWPRHWIWPPRPGAFVSEVVPDSAAEQAGIEPGDGIVKVDDKEIAAAATWFNSVGLRSVGEEVTAQLVGKDGQLKPGAGHPGRHGDFRRRRRPPVTGRRHAGQRRGTGLPGSAGGVRRPGQRSRETAACSPRNVIFRVNRTDVAATWNR